MTDERRENKGGITGVLGVVAVLCSYALARIFPGLGTGRLIAALGSDYESRRMAAHIALVKLGPRCAPRLLAAIDRGHPEAAALVQILGGHGDPALLPRLEELAASGQPEIADAATAAIALLRD